MSSIRLAIVIPTRNRPDLAVRAMQSVRVQADGRVALAISDNSGADGRRQLRSLVDDSGVEILVPPREMPMGEHWNWALASAIERFDPTHVTFLTDRMILKRQTLSVMLDRIIQPFPESLLVYNHDEVDDTRQAVRISPQRSSGSVFKMDPMELLDSVAHGNPYRWETPRMLNSIAPRAVIDRIRVRAGRVLGSHSPDFYFGYWAAALLDEFLCWQASPIVHYALNRSNGHSVQTGLASQDLRDPPEIRTHIQLETPFPDLYTITNVMFHEYGVVARESGSERFQALRREVVEDALRKDAPEVQDLTLRAKIEDAIGPPAPDRGLGIGEADRLMPRLKRRLRERVTELFGVINPCEVPRRLQANGLFMGLLTYRSTEDALNVASGTNRRAVFRLRPATGRPALITKVWPQ